MSESACCVCIASVFLSKQSLNYFTSKVVLGFLEGVDNNQIVSFLDYRIGELKLNNGCLHYS